MLLYIIWAAACLSALYLYFKHAYSYFKKQNINHLRPFPLVGNMGKALTRQEHMVGQMEKLYHSFPNDRFVGHYEVITPIIFIRDPKLIKQITVKDFDHFLNHRAIISEENDPLFGKNLFSLKDQKWRDMRSTLSPAFTGSKMRHMVPFMKECGEDMLNALMVEVEKSGGSLDLETKDLCTRYASDVVASCAFGLKVNSHKDKDNYFYTKGKVASNFTFVQLLKFFGFTSFPKIMSILKMKLFPENISIFFRHIVLSTMKTRDENNIIRPDMIHLLMEARKGTLSHESKHHSDEDAGFATVEESDVGKNSTKRVWSDDDLIAQAVLFFLAGFDTVATVMAFLLHELALNPDVQDKLFLEIKEQMGQVSEMDYSVLQKMKYLDMVVSESMRKWPPVVATDRICTKQYNLGKAHENSTEDTIINKGQGVWCSVWGLLHDPVYYPEPDKFIPERFSDENKHNIDLDTYLPFGVGPRNCIGSRFALMEVKILCCHIVSKFILEPSKKTRIPVQLSPETFNLRMVGGHWVKIRPRI